MPWSYSAETMAQVQGHVEGSTLTYAEIARLTGVSATSVRVDVAEETGSVLASTQVPRITRPRAALRLIAWQP